MILRPGDFHFPDSAARLYPETPQRPWVLEIGFGDGRFWPHYAASFTEAPNYLGAEISGTSVLKAARRLKAAELNNAVLTKLPADVLLREVVPVGSLAQIAVNFPDPWPKAGHEDHRLLRLPFFRLAASRLRPDGFLMLTTDHADYFAFACAQAEASGVMRVETGDSALPPPAALETKYARKWRDLGLSVYHARFMPLTQPDEPSSGFFPYSAGTMPADRPQEDTVPHAILKLPEGFNPATFPKYTARDPEGRWTAALLELEKSLPREEDDPQRGWAALAHVSEGDLTQEVLITLTPRPGGTALARLSRFGGPIITPGVKGAVGAFTEALEGLGATVLHRGY